MTEREAFEAWYTDRGYALDPFHKAVALDFWQASRKVALEDAVEICEELKSAYHNLSESTLLTTNGKTVHQGMYGGAYNCAAAIKELK